MTTTGCGNALLLASRAHSRSWENRTSGEWSPRTFHAGRHHLQRDSRARRAERPVL